MKVQSSHRFARIAPQKARYVVDQVRGRHVDEALSILQFSKRRAAVFIRRVLDSAIASATSEHDADTAHLYIIEAMVDEGPRLKRFRPRAQGRAFGILKRSCHIRLVLGDRGRTDDSEE